MNFRTNEIVETLQSSDTRALFDQMVEGLDTLKQDEVELIHKFYNDTIEGISSSINDLRIDDDDSEAHGSLPSLWLEIRLEWNRYNNQMQYQTFSLGEAKPFLMAKGACLSYILGVIETFINSEDLFWVYKIASEPVESIKYRTSLANRFYDLVESFDKCSQLTNESLFQSRDDIVIRNPDLIKKMDHTILKVAEIYAQSVWLNVKDLNENLLVLLTPWLRKSNTRAVLNIGDCDQNIRIAPEVATAFRTIAEEWMKCIFSIREKNAKSRHAFNESHVNISWSVKREKGRLRFEFIEDSDSSTPVELDLKRFAHLGVLIETSKVDSSSSLVFHCDLRSLHEYLVVRQAQNDKFQLFGISTNYVVRIEKNVSVIELDKIKRLASINSSQNLPLISLKESTGFGAQATTSKSSYVVIDDVGAGQFVIEVEEVVGIVRGSLKPGIGIKESKSCLGVVIGGDSLINIIDVHNLKGAS